MLLIVSNIIITWTFNLLLSEVTIKIPPFSNSLLKDRYCTHYFDSYIK